MSNRVSRKCPAAKRFRPLHARRISRIIRRMNGLIIQPSSRESRSITLHTKTGSCISNEQCDISLWDKGQFKEYEDRWPLTETRCEPTGIFNCHGLTFASRRTCVSDANEVKRILELDGYETVNQSNVMPGDIVLYRGEKGDIEHSGIVVDVPKDKETDFGIPKIVSKWGKFKEFIHRANQCPYNYLTATYHRIKK
jgi:hypothetical protein